MDTPNLSLLKKAMEADAMKKDLSDIIEYPKCEDVENCDLRVQSQSDERTSSHYPIGRGYDIEHYEIEIPVARHIPYDDVMAVCNRFQCFAIPSKNDGYYLIRTGHPINFFWLGMNFNNFINKGQHK